MNFCPNCGASSEGKKFCGECGTTISGQPQAAAVPLPKRKGMSGCFKVFLLIGGILFFILLAASLARKSDSESHPVPHTSEVSSGGLTMANYNSISTGMSYREVVSILGEEGTEMSRNEIGGYTTVMYMWKKWSGANMNAMFQNGKLVQEAQFGLR